MATRVPVHVQLLNEGVDVWRPTSAFALADGSFVLSNENYDPATEEWAVTPGSLISINTVKVEGGIIPVATSLPATAKPHSGWLELS